jgi:hypothetical protein
MGSQAVAVFSHVARVSMSRRDVEIQNAMPIHDHCVLVLKRCPKYEHEARDVNKLMRFLRQQDIRPLDVDTMDSLKG